MSNEKCGWFAPLPLPHDEYILSDSEVRLRLRRRQVGTKDSFVNGRAKLLLNGYPDPSGASLFLRLQQRPYRPSYFASYLYSLKPSITSLNDLGLYFSKLSSST